MKKNFITGVIVGGLVFGAAGAFAGQYVATDNYFPVTLNGERIPLNGYNIEGSTYFKLRDIADKVGSFTVDFQNDTILLSTKIDSTVETVPYALSYYSEYPWCPDFGAVTGATFKEKESDKYYYTATQDDVTNYENILKTLGFVQGNYLYAEEGLTKDKWIHYVKNNKFISIFNGADINFVGILTGQGDWVSSAFAPFTN